MAVLGKILLPIEEETAAIALKPKTAALCYDRVWGTSDRTIGGTIEQSLGGKMFLKAFVAGEALNLSGYPNLGFLVGAGIVIGKIAIKLTQAMLGYDDIEHGPNSEISWVYEAKKRLN